MRFGRNGPLQDFDRGNAPALALRTHEPFQRRSRQASDPFLRFGRADGEIYYPAPDPFLRAGRKFPRMVIGTNGFPYHRYGRDYIQLINDGQTPSLSLDTNGERLLEPDTDVYIVTRAQGYLQEPDTSGRRKRSINTQTEEGPQFQDKENKVWDEDENTVEARASNAYMRFGKKNSLDQANYKYSSDKELKSPVNDEIEKRKSEYMRFGRALEVN